jgi:hypothetical protein
VTDFGDFDPEDAYDAGDPPAMRVAVLRRIANNLRAGPDDGRRDSRVLDALRILDILDAEHPELEHDLDQIRLILEGIV